MHSLIMMFDDFRRVEYTHTQEHKLSLPGKRKLRTSGLMKKLSNEKKVQMEVQTEGGCSVQVCGETGCRFSSVIALN